MQENQSKQQQTEAAFRQLRESRLKTLFTRLQIAAEMRSNVLKQRESLLESTMERLQRTEKEEKLRKKVKEVEIRKGQVAAKAQHYRILRADTTDMKLQFEDCFGTSEAEGVISVFKRALYPVICSAKKRTFSLRAKQDAGQAAGTHQSVHSPVDRELQRTQKWPRDKVTCDIPLQTLIHMATAAFDRIYRRTQRVDVWGELSCRDFHGDLTALMLVVGKRVVTAMEFTAQSQRLPLYLSPFLPSQPRIPTYRTNKTEVVLKSAVCRSNFLPNFSQTNKVLAHPVIFTGPQTSTEDWKLQEPGKEVVERLETSYWKATRNTAKRGKEAKSLSGCRTDRHSRLSLSSSKASIPSFSSLEKPDFASILSELRTAQKKVDFLQRDRHVRGDPSHTSTQTSSKTKDSSLATCFFPRVS